MMMIIIIIVIIMIFLVVVAICVFIASDFSVTVCIDQRLWLTKKTVTKSIFYSFLGWTERFVRRAFGVRNFPIFVAHENLRCFPPTSAPTNYSYK